MISVVEHEVEFQSWKTLQENMSVEILIEKLKDILRRKSIWYENLFFLCVF